MENESKFRFMIFPDRKYTLIWDDLEVEVTGEDIMAQFRRSSYLEHLIHTIDENNSLKN